MKNNLIIGANSFLGRTISKLLFKAGHQVSGLFHRNTDKLFSGVTSKPVSELSKLKDDYDNIFIIGAHIPEIWNSQTNHKLFKTNVKLVETVCDRFISARIIYASALQVIRTIQDTTLEVNDSGGKNRLELMHLYALSKLWGEFIVQKTLNHAIVRISSMYGLGMRSSTFLPKIIIEALLNDKITIWGDGSRLQNYVHVHDVAQYMIKSSEYQNNAIFLAVGEKSYSNLEIAQLVKQLTGVEIVFQGEDRSPSFQYNNRYTNKELKYCPKIDIRTGIAELAQWIKRSF